QAPERLVERRPHRIRECAGDELGHSPHEHQEIVDHIFGVRPEMAEVAVPEKGHRRSQDEHEGKVWEYAQDPRRHEAGPTRRFLQRPVDQKAAETEKDLDREFAEVLSVSGYRRLRKPRQVEMMTEQDGRSGTEAHEIVAVLGAGTHQLVPTPTTVVR